MLGGSFASWERLWPVLEPARSLGSGYWGTDSCTETFLLAGSLHHQAFAPDTSHLSTALSTHRHWLNTCSSNNSAQWHQHLLPRSASRIMLKLWIFHLASLNLLRYFIWLSWCTEQPMGLSHMLAAWGPATQNRLSIREQPVLTAWAFLPPEGIKAL